MNNLFLNAAGLSMHEKYDIKGSWVARNAEPPSNGQTVTCTHCEQKFVYFKKYKTKRSLRKQRVNSLNLDTPSDSRAVLEIVNTDNGKDITTIVNPMNSTHTHSVKSPSDEKLDLETGTVAASDYVTDR